MRLEVKGVSETVGNTKHAACAFVVYNDTGKAVARCGGYLGEGFDAWVAEYVALLKCLYYLRANRISGATVVIGQRVIVDYHLRSGEANERLQVYLSEAFVLISETKANVIWEKGTSGSEASQYAKEKLAFGITGHLEAKPFSPKQLNPRLELGI